MQVDAISLVLASAGILLAVAVAILVGTVTARLFSRASEAQAQDASDPRQR